MEGFSGQRKNKYKGPEAEMRLMGVRSEKRPAWLTEWARGELGLCYSELR